jgi:myo-inositol 2-dehydrogenase / D-chiro-inositol 1-dehydrogenase
MSGRGRSARVSEPVQLALIGAGRMGRMHLQAVAESDAVRIAAVVDPFEEARHAAAAVHGRAKGCASIDEAVDQDRIDGVLIAAPTPLHRQLVRECARRGLPILCEKPCGLTTDEIDAAAQAARAAQVMLQIGYWRRFVPELVALRDDLRAGRFGALLQISCAQWDEEPPSAEFRNSSGGIMVDMGVHELDQIRWLTGRELEPANMVATAGQAAGDVDGATCVFDVDGGGIAVVSLGRCFPHGDCVWVELMGTRDYARVDVLWGDRGKTWHPALRAQAEDFARCIRSGEQSAGATAQDARRTLELAALAQSQISVA